MKISIALASTVMDLMLCSSWEHVEYGLDVQREKIDRNNVQTVTKA